MAWDIDGRGAGIPPEAEERAPVTSNIPIVPAQLTGFSITYLSVMLLQMLCFFFFETLATSHFPYLLPES